MGWGHAVSPDLLRWNETDVALPPDASGLVEGSIVLDVNNTAGIRSDGSPVPIAVYTSGGSPHVAFSVDGGKTWTPLEGVGGAPFTDSAGGASYDPKVFWHDGTKRWILLLSSQDGSVGLYSSPNFLAWTHLQSIVIDFGGQTKKVESPDMFQLHGATSDLDHWILWLGDSWYQVGQFDGHKFESKEAPKRLEYGKAGASATFSSTPSGRKLQVSWIKPPKHTFETGMGDTFSRLPFTGVMAYPVELDLVKIDNDIAGSGVRLRRRPAAELRLMRRQPALMRLTPARGLNGERVAGGLLEHGNALRATALNSKALDLHIRANLQFFGPAAFYLSLRGIKIRIAGNGSSAEFGAAPPAPGMCSAAMLSTDFSVGPLAGRHTALHFLPLCADETGFIEFRLLWDRITMEGQWQSTIQLEAPMEKTCRGNKCHDTKIPIEFLEIYELNPLEMADLKQEEPSELANSSPA